MGNCSLRISRFLAEAEDTEVEVGVGDLKAVVGWPEVIDGGLDIVEAGDGGSCGEAGMEAPKCLVSFI